MNPIDWFLGQFGILRIKQSQIEGRNNSLVRVHFAEIDSPWNKKNPWSELGCDDYPYFEYSIEGSVVTLEILLRKPMDSGPLDEILSSLHIINEILPGNEIYSYAFTRPHMEFVEKERLLVEFMKRSLMGRSDIFMLPKSD